MKVSVAALFVFLLILTTASMSSGQPDLFSSVCPGFSCCPNHIEKPLPKKLVVGYREAFFCAPLSIIFVTKRNREICAKLSDKWVRDYINDPNIPMLPCKD